MRRKAGRELPGSIDQPCLVVFGTAIPNHYYEALSERMLTNGFFARMIIIECGERGKGKDAKVLKIPERVIATANRSAIDQYSLWALMIKNNRSTSATSLTTL